ncbi:MAG TPA: hypothetical protein VNQ79_00280 [Blastocatellia bacterium]|nr:hypothetical protein [Blastocatellia bacterium]
MNRLPVLFIIVLASGLATWAAQQLQRLPLQKKRIELKSPSSWSKRIVKIDPRTKEEVYYDPNPRIELADARAGKYYLKWIGYDGKEKVVVYQRPDCIDVIVSASTTKSASGTYEYEYTIQNLATSGDYLNGFAVQNFSSTISPKRPSKVNDVIVGDMTSGPYAVDSKEGNWIRFATVPPHPKVHPGQIVRFKLYSPSPPGLVRCGADGGSRVMKGVGEEMPEELEASLDILGYEAWPSGYTVGPVDSLKTFSQSDRAEYVLKLLPQFQKLGWMTQSSSRWYKQNLNRADLETVYRHATQDFKAGHITSEVIAIIEGMKNQQ